VTIAARALKKIHRVLVAHFLWVKGMRKRLKSTVPALLFEPASPVSSTRQIIGSIAGALVAVTRLNIRTQNARDHAYLRALPETVDHSHPALPAHPDYVKRAASWHSILHLAG
jgi:hypothetical protein